jgi:molybdenum cofactor cytidylyltransferase
MTLAGLILCGGASRRMGTPKALLDFGGETVLDRLIRLLSACCDPVTVVLGHEPGAILSGIRSAGSARFVVNADYAEGQTSSLRRGLADLAGAGGVLFMPVDYPAVAAETVAALAAAIREDDGGKLLFIPRYQGSHGHPVCLRAGLIGEFTGLAPEATAREVIHRHTGRTRYVDVDDPGILRDMDDPADYERLRAAHKV